MLLILHLKHTKLHKLSWIETQKNLIPTKLNNDTAQICCYIIIIYTPLLAHGQKIMLDFLLRQLWILSTTTIQPTTIQDQSMSLHLLVCA